MALTSTVASSSTKLSPPKRLGELLEEQQEPFVLEIYLLERGCRRKGLDFKGGNIGCFSTDQDNNIETTKFSKKSSSFNGLNPSRKSSAQLSSITKSLYNKLISVNKVRKSKNGSKVKKSRKRDKETVDSGRCSSASCSTLSNITWSASDTDGDSMPSPVKNAIELAADRVTAQWRLVDENKQCSPVSVLDEIDLLQAIPVYNVRQDQGPPAESRITYQKKVSDDSLLSASLWELLLQSRKEKPKKTGSKSLPQFINSKKALQQTRQLLFDCVREVVEENNNGKQKRIKKDKGLMGPEEIGKIICSNLKAWGKLSADETNIKTLLRTDLLGSAGGWGGFEACKPDIVVEIGNCIVEEITDDIVRDMINLN